MPTAEYYVRQLSGQYMADLLVRLAVANARIDELEQELKTREREPAKEPA